MAKFPTYEEMAKKVAEKALDEFLYNGKSIREWMQIIVSEDCISRQAVLEQTYNWSKDEFLRITNPFDYLRKRINSLPPITPQRKMGRWILQPSNKEQGERDFIWWKCSKCGQVIYSETEKDRREYHAYCGRCGIKMQEVEE